MNERTAIVWGAAGGIGRALVDRLADEGWRVIAVTHSGAAVDRATLSIEADAGNAFDVERAVVAASQEAGEVDLFIYAAGDITAEPVAAMTPQAWRRILDANLTGAFNAAHSTLPLLTPTAPLVFIGAVSERMRLPGLSAYAAAKAGLEAFAESLRKEERKRKVMVVRPGAVATDFWDKVPFTMPSSALAPAKVAESVLAALMVGHQGALDL